MTNPYEDLYVIKLDAVEASASGIDGAVEDLMARIKAESSPSFQFIRRPDGVAVPTIAAAENIIDNPRINREGCEVYLDMDSSWASVAR